MKRLCLVLAMLAHAACKAAMGTSPTTSAIC